MEQAAGFGPDVQTEETDYTATIFRFSETRMYKTGYNILLAHHSIPLAIHVNVNGWTVDEIEALSNLSYRVLWDALVSLE